MPRNTIQSKSKELTATIEAALLIEWSREVELAQGPFWTDGEETDYADGTTDKPMNPLQRVHLLLNDAEQHQPLLEFGLDKSSGKGGFAIKPLLAFYERYSDSLRTATAENFTFAHIARLNFLTGSTDLWYCSEYAVALLASETAPNEPAIDMASVAFTGTFAEAVNRAMEGT